MVDVALAVTTTVAIENLALLAPAAMVTLAGTVANAVLLLARVTTTLAGALPVSVAVPVTVLPPAVVVALSAREDRTGGTTVRSRAMLTPPDDAVIRAVVDDARGLVVIENVACVWPA